MYQHTVHIQLYSVDQSEGRLRCVLMRGLLYFSGVFDTMSPHAFSQRLERDACLSYHQDTAGAAQARPWLESTRFQSLIVKRIHSAFNLNPGFV